MLCSHIRIPIVVASDSEKRIKIFLYSKMFKRLTNKFTKFLLNFKVYNFFYLHSKDDELFGEVKSIQCCLNNWIKNCERNLVVRSHVARKVHCFLAASFFSRSHWSHISWVWTWIQAGLRLCAQIFPFFHRKKSFHAWSKPTHTLFSVFFLRHTHFFLFFFLVKYDFQKPLPIFWSIFFVFISKSCVLYSDKKTFFKLIRYFFISLNTHKTGWGILKSCKWVK